MTRSGASKRSESTAIKANPLGWSIPPREISATPQGDPVTARQFENGGHRDRETAMGRLHRTMPHRGGFTADLVRVEVMQSGTDTDHIDDGIDGTNLMEVHTIGRQAMDARLSLCKGGEHRQHAAF